MRRICAVISTVSMVCLIEGPLCRRRVNNRWPAVIFAVKRTASVPGRIKLLIVLYTQPLKMELTEGSETSANHNLTPGKYPKEYIQYSKQGESLKSRTK
jgi:hypothetical protein